MNIVSMTLRLLLAVALGGIIGIERETSRKPAGLRTNILICVSSAMMMIVAELFSGKNGSGQEVMRVAAGVITGVGFLGAGAIIQARGTVHGLTTASVIWAVAGLGLAVGAGYYLISIVFTLIVVLILVFLRKIEQILLKRSEKNHPHVH
ncbi:MAG: MgtC/SapB family protein [Candidatus Aminicenantes bacterium]|jgi:putative Mg2+ transporter-C (MgtC) family protein|nr:MgtC/SapB family protein [Candidatus Aminicenantes bacterium]